MENLSLIGKLSIALIKGLQRCILLIWKEKTSAENRRRKISLHVILRDTMLLSISKLLWKAFTHWWMKIMLLDIQCCNERRPRRQKKQTTYLEVNFEQLIDQIEHSPFLTVFRGCPAENTLTCHLLWACSQNILDGSLKLVVSAALIVVWFAGEQQITYLSLAQTLKQPMMRSAAFSNVSPSFPLPFFLNWMSACNNK